MFTKLHKEERELLFKTNSVVAYEVYMHLKDKYSYFKAECYDLGRCISDYLDVPERTVKDAIKRLKTVGLITTTKRGKVNIYNFPILNKIEGIKTKEDMIETPQVTLTGYTADSKPSNDTVEVQPQQEEEKPTEAIKSTINDIVPNEFMDGLNDNTTEEENLKDMGTLIGYIETPTQEVKFDNFSDTLNDLLDEYEGVIEQLTDMLAKANISDDVYIISTAKMAEMRIKNIAKELITEIDKTNYTNYINERIATKTKRLQVA